MGTEEGLLYVQKNGSSAVVHSECITTISQSGRIIMWTENVELLARILKALREPMSIYTLSQLVLVGEESLVACLNALVDAGVVRTCNLDRTPERVNKVTAMVLGICGSIQAAAMLPIATNIKDRFAKTVHVVFTETAKTFASTRAYQKLGFVVWSEKGEETTKLSAMSHMDLVRQSSLCLVAPATAHFISRLASGACSDYLSLVALAHQGPVVIAPCMNEAMLRSPAVSRNLAQLRDDGCFIVEPRGEELLEIMLWIMKLYLLSASQNTMFVQCCLRFSACPSHTSRNSCIKTTSFCHIPLGCDARKYYGGRGCINL